MAAALEMRGVLETVAAFSFENARQGRGYQESLKEWRSLKRRARAVLADATQVRETAGPKP